LKVDKAILLEHDSNGKFVSEKVGLSSKPVSSAFKSILNTLKEIDADLIQINDILKVLPGSKIPTGQNSSNSSKQFTKLISSVN